MRDRTSTIKPGSSITLMLSGIWTRWEFMAHPHMSFTGPSYNGIDVSSPLHDHTSNRVHQAALANISSNFEKNSLLESILVNWATSMPSCLDSIKASKSGNPWPGPSCLGGRAPSMWSWRPNTTMVTRCGRQMCWTRIAPTSMKLNSIGILSGSWGRRWSTSGLNMDYTTQED